MQEKSTTDERKIREAKGEQIPRMFKKLMRPRVVEQERRQRTKSRVSQKLQTRARSRRVLWTRMHNLGLHSEDRKKETTQGLKK